MEIAYNWQNIFIEKMKSLFPKCKVCENTDLGGFYFVRKGFLCCFWGKTHVSVGSATPKNVSVTVYTAEGLEMMGKFQENNPSWTIKIRSEL